MCIRDSPIPALKFNCGYQELWAIRIFLAAPSRRNWAALIPVSYTHLDVYKRQEQADQDAVILVDDEKNKKSTSGTVSYMPAVFGCYLAEYVIRRI